MFVHWCRWRLQLQLLHTCNRRWLTSPIWAGNSLPQVLHFGRDWAEALASLAFLAAGLFSTAALRRCSASSEPSFVKLCQEDRSAFRVVFRLSLKRSLGRPTARLPSTSSPYRSTFGSRLSSILQNVFSPSGRYFLPEVVITGYASSRKNLCVRKSVLPFDFHQFTEADYVEVV